MSLKRTIAGLSSLALATALLAFLSKAFHPSGFAWTAFLLLVAGFQSMVAFGGLGWALERPGKAFFSIFVGDALLKLVWLGFAVYWLGSRSMPYAAPLLSLGYAYLLLSIVQIPFFHRAR